MITSHLDGNLLTWQVGAMGLVDLPLTGHAYRAPSGEVVWIDPPEVGEHEARLLELGKPAHILVTFRDHDRAVPALLQRHGAKFWAPKGHEGSIPTPDVAFDEGTELPAGLRAIGMPAMGFGEHALVAEAYGLKFAFVGDAVFSFEGMKTPWLVKKLAFKAACGPLQMKRSYRGGDNAAAPEQLRKLAAERPDMLFLSHGHPVTEATHWLEACLK
ncbi:MAG: fold metallo-hydrolase [Cyanobacteria bacterium RYN_339]|nr:fold metallo-hydrolase [Cyanobacteria bacterium RYN_339]